MTSPKKYFFTFVKVAANVMDIENSLHFIYNIGWIWLCPYFTSIREMVMPDKSSGKKIQGIQNRPFPEHNIIFNRRKYQVNEKST